MMVKGKREQVFSLFVSGFSESKKGVHSCDKHGNSLFWRQKKEQLWRKE